MASNEAVAESVATMPQYAYKEGSYVRVSQALQVFLATKLPSKWSIISVEAGGGGDCLFHSFATLLEVMLRRGGQWAQHVQQKVPAATLNGTNAAWVQDVLVESLFWE